MPGSGKSCIGRVLSDVLGCSFYDSDDLIIKETGRSIADIFMCEGEDAFRKIEKDVILKLLTEGQGVIATGGGAVTTPEVLQSIKMKAISVWLNSSIDSLVERTERTPEKRPLLVNGNLQARLQSLFAKRENLYKQADIVVDSSKGNVDKIIKILHDALVPYADKNI